MRCLMVVLLLAGITVVAVADDYGWDPASVDIGGQHVLKFRDPAAGMSAADRRAMLEFRMTKALTHTEYLFPVQMSYLRVPGGIAVASNGIYFLTVTPDDARSNRSSIRTLSRQWGTRIKQTFETVGPARQLPHEMASQPDLLISLD
jgi:hypothetical protein